MRAVKMRLTHFFSRDINYLIVQLKEEKRKRREEKKKKSEKKENTNGRDGETVQLALVTNNRNNWRITSITLIINNQW